MRILLVSAIIAFTPVLASAACPAQDHVAIEAQKAPLFDRLLKAPGENEAREIAQEIWAIWTVAPDAKAQDLLDKGVQRIGWADYLEAEAILNDLVDYCPDYAEGWNQRAFAKYLREDLDGAIADLDQAIALEPRHFGALAGRGLSLLRQGKQALGESQIREALKVHPWLGERNLLPPEEKI